MAKMIPDLPKEFDSKSQEGLMFDELSSLSDDYYVFHSFSIVLVKKKELHESETDFVIFHPKKGIICLEAKAGQVDYTDGAWRYGSGIKMKKDGPYNQASANKWKLKDYMIEKGLQFELEKCKLLHAVWFPDIPLSKIKGRQLPSEADPQITLTSDSFGRIEEEISRIFSYDISAGIITDLSERDVKNILEKVLAPSFSLISLGEVQKERTQRVFKRMLTEQVALLNYLEEQNNAIINGLAGTGKTVMAVEKARMHADKGEKVLFLCYNSFLKEYLKSTYENPYISYYTIDGFTCKICDTEKSDYNILEEKLLDDYCTGNFPYQHIIIDEGQDFGKDELEEINIISLLKDIAISNNDVNNTNRTFYLFYDKNQMIQSDNVPKYIEEADCKLTLYRNCRNTTNIAQTSLRFLGSDSAPRLADSATLGDIPKMGFITNVENAVELLNRVIEKYFEDGYSMITILTCKTETSSIFAEYVKDSVYRYKNKNLRFTTCRKFKGLESDVVILVDIDRETFDDGTELMYVGASRAKYKLSCLVNMSEEECLELMKNREMKYSKNIFKSFATAFNAKLI